VSSPSYFSSVTEFCAGDLIGELDGRPYGQIISSGPRYRGGREVWSLEWRELITGKVRTWSGSKTATDHHWLAYVIEEEMDWHGNPSERI
jgi:hypothetical protein